MYIEETANQVSVVLGEVGDSLQVVVNVAKERQDIFRYLRKLAVCHSI